MYNNISNANKIQYGNFSNDPKVFMTQHSQSCQNSSSASSVVLKTNKYTYRLFKPFSRLPCFPKKTRTLHKGITGFFILIAFLTILIIVLGLIPIYQDKHSKKESFSIQFVDAFKRNNSELFRIAVKSSNLRTFNENKTIANVLSDINDQLNKKILSKISDKLETISNVKIAPLQNSDEIIFSFSATTKKLTSFENNKLKNEIKNSTDPSLFDEIKINNFQMNTLVAKEVSSEVELNSTKEKFLTGIPIIELENSKFEAAPLVESPPEIVLLESKKLTNKNINSKKSNQLEGKLIVNKKFKSEKQQKTKELFQGPDIKLITKDNRLKLVYDKEKNEDIWVINIPKVKQSNSGNKPFDPYKFIPVLLKDLKGDKSHYYNSLREKNIQGYKKVGHELTEKPDVYIVSF